MDVPDTKRIVLAGKTGVGKSSLANTIFGEAILKINHLNGLAYNCTQAETKSVNGRSLSLIDTPGLFYAEMCDEDMKPEVVRCNTECAPGPHAFLIVLKVEKFTEHERAVIAKICDFFSEDALKYAAVVFTYGDQLPEGMTIEEYVEQSEGLSDLVKKCGGRCHVVDNKYWKADEDDNYRSNQFQVAELLNTIDEIVRENNGGCYTNDELQEVEKAIQKEEERIKKSSGSSSQEEIRRQAKGNVFMIMTEKKPKTRIRALVGIAVIAGVLAAVSAVIINLKVGRQMIEATTEIIATPIAPIVTVVEEISKVVPDVTPVVSEIVEAVEEVIQPVVEITPAYEVFINHWYPLFEKYDPWNLF